MASLLAQLEDKRQALEDERSTLLTKAEEAGSFNDVRERIEEIDAELPGVLADRDRAAAERKRIATAPAILVEGPDGKEGPVEPLGALTKPVAGFASQFLNHEKWQAFVEAQGDSGFSHGKRIESPKIPLKGSPVAWLRQRAEVNALGLSDNAGELVLPGQTGIFDSPYARELRVVDLITRGSTNSSSVDYVRHDYDPQAEMVAEATHIKLSDEAGSGVSHKPWSLLEFERVNAPVKTLAVGTPATNSALSDAGQLRTLIDSALRYDLAFHLEEQIVSGDGTGEDFDGILEEATGTQSFSNSVAETLRKAKTKVRFEGRARPNGIVMNPEDAEKLDIELLDGGVAYYRAGTITELPTIWALPIVESEAVTKGTAIVADFRLAILWDRQQASIEATSGYMDFFMRNMVAIRAELRAAFGVIRPSAFVITNLGS